MLDYPSTAIKDGTNQNPVDDIVKILKATCPERIYTHNLADKHDTHIGVALRVISAVRALPETERPEKLYGCEVWRDITYLYFYSAGRSANCGFSLGFLKKSSGISIGV